MARPAIPRVRRNGCPDQCPDSDVAGNAAPHLAKSAHVANATKRKPRSTRRRPASSKDASFRVGKVTAYLRGKVWYLCYYEHGERRRPRVGPERAVAEQLAAQTNAQLAIAAPTPLSFEPLGIAQLRERWLHYHEHVRRSSVATVQRYRTASAHLIDFVRKQPRLRLASHFNAVQAEAFAAYLRQLRVAPNGHAHTAKRPLRDKGVKFILEVCRSLFSYAARRRHLPPYTENPFTTIEIDRIPIEDARPFVGFDPQQEQEFLRRCDEWEFPLFLTLLLTGLRPGELRTLLWPDDLDLDAGWLHVRNKPELGWRVKTRNERAVPLVPEMSAVLRVVLDGRECGPVFLRQRCRDARVAPLIGWSRKALAGELQRRLAALSTEPTSARSRMEERRCAVRLWQEMGAVPTDRMRTVFMRLTKSIGLPQVTAPKTLRHMFATALQDANVDPLIRNQVMGHVPSGQGHARGGLAMTGVYTHSRPETIRRQILQALNNRPAVEMARAWLQQRGRSG